MRGNNAKGAALVPLVVLPSFLSNEMTSVLVPPPNKTLFLLEKEGLRSQSPTLHSLKGPSD